MRGYDWHHDHRSTVTGNSSDTVLVDDDRFIPFELSARSCHRMSERKQLIASHEARRTDEEGGNLHIRIAVVHEIVDDSRDFRRAQRIPLYLGSHAIETGRGDSRRNRD